MGGPEALDLRVLGPVELWADGRRIELGRPKHRTLFALLLLDANRVVPIDRVVDLIWGQHPPRAARNSVQVMVSGLRDALAAGGVPADRMELITRPPGYQLTVDPAYVDLHRFTELVERAGADDRDDRRAALLREALQLWRGPALADAGANLRERMGGRLDEARLAALEDRVDADLRLGRHRSLIEELTELTRSHPLRDRPAAQLMLAYYREGRQSDALAEYRRIRTQLAEELGTDPGPELTRLHERILRNEPSLLDPTGSSAERWPPPAQLPGEVSAFVGRDAELARLDELAATACTPGESCAVLLSALVGGGGVGKTTLAVHWAHRAASAWPDGQLFLDLRGYGPGQPVEPAEALEQFLRALGIEGNRIPAGLDERAALYRSRLDGVRMLIILDNARTSEQVRPLLPGSSSCFTVITSRNRLDGLVVRNGAISLRLDVLSPEAATTLVARVLGAERAAAEPDAVARLAELCDRLPLALRIAAARASAEPDRPVRELAAELADEQRRLSALAVEDDDTAVRATFELSYRALPAEQARLFRLLGLPTGVDIAVPAAAALAGVDSASATELLTGLEAASLVTTDPQGRYRLHDLLRLYARERLEAEETAPDRATAARRLLDYYVLAAELGEAALNPYRAQIPVRSVEYRPVDPPTALVEAEALAWFDEEVGNLVAAVRWADELGLDDPTWQLTDSMFGYFMRRHRLAEWVETHRLALAAVRRADRPDGEKVILNALAIVCSQLGRHEEALGWYDAAIKVNQKLGDDRGVAIVLLNIGTLLGAMGRFDQAVSTLEQCTAMFAEFGDVPSHGVSLGNLGFVLRRAGRFERAEKTLVTALEAARKTGNTYSECDVGEDLAGVYLAQGKHAAAMECYRAALTVARESGVRIVEARILDGIGDVWAATGDPAAARRSWTEALAAFEIVDSLEADRVRTKLDRFTPVTTDNTAEPGGSPRSSPDRV